MKIKLITERWHRFHWFIVGVIILKIILMGMFSSDYQDKLFMPFVENFLGSLGSGVNPYDYLSIDSHNSVFPYPPLMLFIESIGGFVVHTFPHLPIFFRNFFFKLPNLLFDFVCLFYLMRLYPDSRKYIAILYFASPIVIYATYMHGQLDLIPTAFLIGSLYYLFLKGKRKEWLFAIFLAAAITTKLHILAILPLLFIYIYKRFGIRHALHLMMPPALLSCMVMLPFFNNNFLASVVFNKEQDILTQVYVQFANLQIFIPILGILVLYIHAFELDNINKDLLLSLTGILFAVFLALIPPMPGWYVWIVPFIAVFFIIMKYDKQKNMLIYFLLNIFYLAYFLFAHQTAYVDLYFFGRDLSALKFFDSVQTNFLFTILSGLLIYTVFLIYKFGVSSNSLYKRRNLPFAIAVAGDSGSGKSAFIKELENVLGVSNLLFIEGDGDHKWERGDRGWLEYTHLNPKANHLYRQALDVQMLLRGASIKRVEYDHHSGKFTEEKLIRPRKYIVLCGLHSLYLPQMRTFMDLKIYMDTDETLRRFWKIQRDISNRGYSKDLILEQIEDRMPDARKYIIPQREYADLIVQYFDDELTDCFMVDHTVHLSLRLTLSAAINLEPLIQSLLNYAVGIQYDYSADLKRQVIVFDGNTLNKKALPLEELGTQLVPQLDELTQQDLNCTNNLDGILRLIVLILISNKMTGESK